MVDRRHNSTARSAFTLIELLAVVAIIGMLSIATVASYQAIANDVRRAGGVEQVKSMLAMARLRALSDARTTALVFRPVITAPGVQQIEGMLAQFSGDAFRYVPEDENMGVQSEPIVARFLPVDSGKPMLLAEGIGVASPCHRLSHVDSNSTVQLYLDGDKQYLTVANLAGMLPEAPGVMIAVLFAGDGSQTILIPEADADWFWVDFNSDGGQRYEGEDYCNRKEEQVFGEPPPACPPALADINAWSPPAAGCWLGTRYLPNGQNSSADLLDDDERLPMCQRAERDEPIVLVAPYLAIYDDRDAREDLDPSRWLDAGTDVFRRAAASRRGKDLTEFIDANARQLHFNPNTGVAFEGASR